jgi:uncharacterized protein
MATPLHARSPRPTGGAAPATAMRKRRPYRSDQTVGAALLALLVAALLGSQSLVSLATQQPYGTNRTVLLGMARGVDRMAHVFALDRPARLVNEIMGRTPPPPVDVAAIVEQRAATTTTVAAPLEVNPATGLRWIGPEEPLRLLLAGDSIMNDLGPAIVAAAPGDLVDSTIDSRISSGLTRPDFFDWPSHLARVLEADRPEAVVLAFGANDHQDVEVDGVILRTGTEAWTTEYGRRVGLVMDLLRRQGTTVTWLTLPAMRSGEFSAAMASLSAVYRDQARTRPWIDVVDLGAVLDAPGGGYTATLPDAGGAPESLRQEDGVHLSGAGARRAAAAVWAGVAERWTIG